MAAISNRRRVPEPHRRSVRERAGVPPAARPPARPGASTTAPPRTPDRGAHAAPLRVGTSRRNGVPGTNGTGRVASPVGTGGALPALDVISEGGAVCLFRALPGIGDLLCAVPAIRALRHARPDVAITLVTHPAAMELAQRYRPYLDEIVPFPGFPGLPDRRPDVRALPGFLASMQSRRFDLAVQLHGTGDRTNDIVRLFGAKRTAGFTPRGCPPPEPMRYLAWQDEEHEALRWLRLLQHLGLPGGDPVLELPVSLDADRQLAEVLAGVGLPGLEGPAPVVVHPGASTAMRRWPARGFATVIDRLVADGRPVFLTGSGTERDVTALVHSLVEHPGAVTDLAGRTSFDALAALLRWSSLLVSNDTGVSHMAAAIGTPSVVVFTATEPSRWAPLDAARHRAVEGGSPRRVAAEAMKVLHGALGG
jgi:ADP-heptose:LPS heptosyltransferase